MKHNLLIEKASHHPDQMLTALKKQHPQLKIIVLDQKSQYFVSKTEVTFQDTSVSEEAFEFYADYTAAMIQSVAFYLTPFGELTGHPDRPLLNHPIMVLKKNAARHVILHELGHFYLDLALRQGLLHQPEDEDLLNIIEGSGEEVYVDLKLLQNAEELQFDEDAFCARHKYLRQNLQVMNSQLKDVLKRKPELNPSDQAVHSHLYDIYSEAQSLRLEHHLRCVFWKP